MRPRLASRAQRLYLQHLGDRVSWTGIVTRPDRRGLGIGTSLAAAVTMRGLHLGRVMPYQTLEANVPSVKVAKALGYRRFGSRLAIRPPLGLQQLAR